jgi:hypothetical protein
MKARSRLLRGVAILSFATSLAAASIVVAQSPQATDNEQVAARSAAPSDSARTANESSPPRGASAESLPAIQWRRDYRRALQEAEDRQAMLFIWLQNPLHEVADEQFSKFVFDNPGIRKLLDETVPLRLPITAKISSGGEEIAIIDQPAFAEMLGKSGIAMIDMTDPRSPQFRRVTTVYPFARQYISASKLAALLQLPHVSLTQRTMIFAVRTHPEHPASASSPASELLLAEAASHSNHQASIQVQGHHNWGSRFQAINARLPAGLVATEVCAESWPGQSLVDAAEECVHSWRQSPGHWSNVRERHALFGYDLKRGNNGIWYGTGIFAHRH